MPVMTSVTMENFRCFRERQAVRLAPLTLLVGENSTGKTSFLALLRILAQLVEGETSFDFKAPPYDLGSFEEIAHSRGGRAGRIDEFTIGACSVRPTNRRRSKKQEVVFMSGRFRKRGAAPTLVGRRAERGSSWIDEQVVDGQYAADIGTSNGSWRFKLASDSRLPADFGSLGRQLLRGNLSMSGEEDYSLKPIDESPEWSELDSAVLRRLYEVSRFPWRFESELNSGPFASAPVRSKPRRTYDPARLDPDPEGDYVPMYLADLSSERPEVWEMVRTELERFGKSSGLFDELVIRQFGKRGSDPFQVQVRKAHKRLKGPMRSLVDVGYGISQVLPLVTEISRPNRAQQYLLQQPEVHLHPSAQAALGSLFCELASEERQLVVETHSDHLMNRIRMEVRDGEIGLKPEDVLLLYFERDGLDVRIHEIRFDAQGNVCGAPESYREFFRLESRRSLGL